MGKPTLFTINLAGGNSVYFPGSSVEGNVLLELPQAKKVQGISIVLTGKAYVYWKVRRSEQHTSGSGDKRETYRESYTVHYSDTQDIFNDMFIQLWGDGRNSNQIAAGKYQFPFKFQLPSDLVLPTSFEGQQYGYIRYSLTSRMQRPWKFDHVATKAITINELIDINTPRLTAPLSSSNEKTLCCLCCTSGPISLDVSIDRAGYCPGESVAISTAAENHSNRRVTAVRATLMQTVVYRAKFLKETENTLSGSHRHHHGHHHHHHFSTSERLENKIIQRIDGPGIEPGGTSNWSNELLPIPATVPSINSCRIINLSYALTVTLCIPGAIDLNVTLPITIGNVPFKGRASNGAYPPVESYQQVNSFPGSQKYVPPPHPQASQESSFNYSTAQPPVNIGLDNYTMGETQYAPVYGFVTDYQFAPHSSNFEAVVKVIGGED